MEAQADVIRTGRIAGAIPLSGRSCRPARSRPVSPVSMFCGFGPCRSAVHQVAMNPGTGYRYSIPAQGVYSWRAFLAGLNPSFRDRSFWGSLHPFQGGFQYHFCRNSTASKRTCMSHLKGKRGIE